MWFPGPVWTGAENLAQPGFDPRIIQPEPTRYTDYAIPPLYLIYKNQFIIINFNKV